MIVVFITCKTTLRLGLRSLKIECKLLKPGKVAKVFFTETCFWNTEGLRV